MSSVRSIRVQYELLRLYPVLSTTIPFAVRLNQEGINTGRPLIGSYNSHIYVTWITDIWPSDLESPDGGFCDGASFSVEGFTTTVCFSVCLCGGAAFLRLLLFFLGGMLGLLFVTGLKRQTRMWTSWNVPSFIGLTRTCAKLRSERTEDVLWSSWTVC